MKRTGRLQPGVRSVPLLLAAVALALAANTVVPLAAGSRPLGASAMSGSGGQEDRSKGCDQNSDGHGQDGNQRGNDPLSCPNGSPTAIQHIVVLMQENRSFDHYFGQLHYQGQPDALAEPPTPLIPTR